MVIDACRDNPFQGEAGRSLGAARGLLRIEAPRGVFGIYSAGFGQSALDHLGEGDTDENSVFTRIFLDLLAQPGLTLVEIAKRTQQEVETLAATASHAQTPGYYDQIVGNVVLNGSGAEEGGMPAIPSQPPPEPAAEVDTDASVASVPIASRAREMFERHVAMGGNPVDEALAYVRDHYAETVRDHGKRRSRAAVVEDKAKYFAKWSSREYTLVPGATQVSCDEIEECSCQIEGQTDFSVSNGAKTLAGRAVVEIDVRFSGDGIEITAEGGRVLR